MVKKQFKTSIQLVLAAVVAVAGVAGTGSQAFAQSTGKVNNSTNVLKVSPVRRDVQVKPGETMTLKTTVTNLTNEAITVKPIENDFIAGDERGTPSLILDENKYAPTHSLKRFLKPITNVTIPAKDSKDVEVVVSVPKTAQAGGYFGAVRFAPTSPDNSGQVSLSTSVASLILLTVPGDLVQKLDLTDFAIQQDGKSGDIFQSSNDLQATFRFQNKGNVQVGPIGKVTVKQGDTVLYETDFNNKDQRDMILPDSARRWDVPLKKIGSFGNYTVTATFSYGTKNETIEMTKSFWVIPQAVIIAAIALIVVVILLIIIVILMLRRRKRHVLRSANGGLKRL